METRLNVFNSPPLEGPMPLKSYYRWALLLPVVVPALTLPLIPVVDSLPPLAVVALIYLWWSMLLGGIPYLLFAGAFLAWMREQPDARVRRGILLAPIAYVLVLAVCTALFLVVDGTFSWETLGLVAAFGLAFGYAYVAIAEGGRLLVRAGGASAGPAVPA